MGRTEREKRLERALLSELPAAKEAKAMADSDAHECQHPVEIDDVRRTMKRRQAVNIGLLGTLLTLVGMIIAVSVYAATIQTNQAHLQSDVARTRLAAEKEATDRRAEDQAIRREFTQTQRANAQTHQELTSTTVEIKTLLQVLAEERRTTRRR